MARKQGATNTGYSVESRPRTSGKPHWRVRIWVDDPNNPGKKQQKTVGTYPTKTAANEAGREAVVMRDRGTFVDPKKITVSELIDRWLASKQQVKKEEQRLTQNTIRDYESAIEKHIKPTLGSVLVKNLTPTSLQAAYDKWAEVDELSAWMIHRCHVVLRQTFRYAVVKDWAYRNLADTVDLPDKPKTSKPTWTAEEVQRFLYVTLHRPVKRRQSTKPTVQPKEYGTAPDSLSPLWHLLACEGLRRGEALGLRWQDFNETDGVIEIRQSVVADKTQGGKAVIQERTKTKSSTREVLLTDATISVLKSHRLRQNAIRLAATEWEDNDLIVCTGKGKPVNPDYVSMAFKQLTSLADVPKIRVHDLRHTVATLLREAGVGLEEVSARLGHSSTTVTANVYSRVTRKRHENTVSAMNNILKESASA